MLRELWVFLTRSFLRDAIMNDSTSEFTVSHFALADDALTDVLSEALVLAVRVNTLKMTSATVVDLLAFLPKDRFFMSLVNFVFASGDGVRAPSSRTVFL
jgi:hypothetical protein